MLVLCSPNTNEIAIAGRADEWIGFAESIRQRANVFETDRIADPRPYDFASPSVRMVRTSSTKLEFQIDADHAVLVKGNDAAFQLLAANMDGFAKRFRSGRHIHFDHASWPSDVSENSAWVVFELSE